MLTAGHLNDVSNVRLILTLKPTFVNRRRSIKRDKKIENDSSLSH